MKELLEDCRRHRKDDETNHRSTLRWCAHQVAWEAVLWKHVQVHDTIKVYGRSVCVRGL